LDLRKSRAAEQDDCENNSFHEKLLLLLKRSARIVPTNLV
jgi:hypothetical protein